MTAAVRSLLHLSLLLALSMVVSGCLPDSAEPDAADSATDSDKTAGKGRKGRGGGGADAKGGGAAMPVSGSTATQKEVGTDPDGKPVVLFQLTNSGGMQVDLTNWGATVLAVRVPDQDERYENVTLAFKKIEDYYVPGPYFGAICGRYSNRIAAGAFSIGDQKFQLATNNDANHLHGGDRGFNRRSWTGKIVKKDGAIGIALQLVSPDGEENYPGTLTVDATYWLTERNELSVEYKATTDKAPVLNLTHHCYWNLAGAGKGTILDHQLTLDCDNFLPVDDTLIPTGKQASVAKTPMDFRSSQSIGSRIKQVEGGYDHCYVINGFDGSLRPVA